jgi:hypothetical protein
MKYLIYELFSGVGFCNQLFSLETAIYLANIANRKLILLVRNPLCHCGRSSWDYGYFLNFFTNEFLNFLPYGIEVYYNKIPEKIVEIINNNEITKKLTYKNKFSELVFVDKDLEIENNIKDINNFCHGRKKEHLNIEENSNYEYLYIFQSNASRCFYNFYTKRLNYILMYDICKSLKFKDFYYMIADNIYNTINIKKNSYNIFIHLRFGDYFKDDNFLKRYNDVIIKNLSYYFDGHKTNLITPEIYFLCDNKNNSDFFKAISKYKIKNVETLTTNYIENFVNKNKMLFYDFNKVKKNDVNYAIIEMLLASKSDEFLGTITSTFSHQIQFLRYCNNKNYNKYCNIENGIQCGFSKYKDCNYDWIKYNYRGGHPISWHVFWNPNLNHSKVLMTIKGKTDGFGSQLQSVFSLIAYCYYKGYSYIHTPFYKMQHNDESLKNFPDYMNKFINIEHKFRSVNDLSNYESSILHDVKEGPFVHGSFSPDFFYNDHILNLFRNIYFSQKKPSLLYNNEYNNIAVHIRRGDVNKDKYISRFSSNEEYIKLLKKINLNKSIIHIYSEGDKNDFQDIIIAFPQVEVIMHLNKNIQTTFHHLVMSDVLVIAKSSFSYCAGLLNKNTKIANLIKNWWHKPLTCWNII